jgi:hypothetical protein
VAPSKNQVDLGAEKEQNQQHTSSYCFTLFSFPCVLPRVFMFVRVREFGVCGEVTRASLGGLGWGGCLPPLLFATALPPLPVTNSPIAQHIQQHSSQAHPSRARR